MRRALVLLPVLLLAGPAVAQMPADPVEAFAVAADLDRQATELAYQLTQLTALQAAQFPEPARAPFREAFAEALAAERVRARLRAYLAQRVDPDTLRAALAWREEPLVRAMHMREEAAAADPEAQVAVQTYALTGRLGRHTVAPEHEARVEALLEASGALDAGAEVFLAVALASNRVNAALLDLEPPDEAALRAQLHGAYREQVAATVRGTALYAYRDADADTLAAYREAVDTPAARAYARIGARAVGHAVAEGIEEAGAAFLATFEALDERGEVDLAAWRAAVRAALEAQAGPPEEG